MRTPKLHNKMIQEYPELAHELTVWGLSSYETAVYLYLLTRTSPTGGSKIALGAGLHRPYVYLALPSLIARGLVTEVSYGKQSRYRAMPPAQFEKLEAKRAGETSLLARALERIAKIDFEQDAELYIGREAMVRHQFEFVKDAPRGMVQYLLGGSGQGLVSVFGEDLPLNARLQAEKEFKTYYLSSNSDAARMDDYRNEKVDLHQRTLPFIPDMLPTIAIRGDQVEIQSYFNPPIVHVIKSKEVAEKFKQFFLGLWEIAKDPGTGK